MSLEPRERRLNILIAILTLALIPLGVLFATGFWNGVWDREVPDCGDWTFDRASWEDAGTADDEALALVRCDALVGLTQADVEGLLGDRQSEESRRWTYRAGAVHDSIGPGDAQALYVRFDRRGEVQGAGLRYGGNGRPEARED